MSASLSRGPDHDPQPRPALDLPDGPPPEPRRITLRELLLVALIPGVLAVILAVLAVRYGIMEDFAEALTDAPAPITALTTLAILTPVVTLVVVWRQLRAEHAAHVRLTRLARLDSLTGLPNRFGLDDQLVAAIESSRLTGMPVAVLFIDLDRFKVVNDTFGHEVGDALMKSVAVRLRQALRPMDQIVRYGGDEFVVICPEVTNIGTGERIAKRVIEALEEPFTIGRQSLSISSSIGIALADHHVASAQQVVRDADVAMYQAKGAGPGAYRVFDRTIGGALTPSAIEDRLRKAVERDEFRVFYQPVVETHNGHIVGVEALLRWHDPERGLISPDDFLPILEETGLIVPVGTWVFTEACRQAMEWRRTWPEHPLELKVNVSARQLSQVDFGDMIARVLDETGLPTTSVFLELTESALMDDVSSAWTMLREAKTRGVRLALDDFGTGFSSLSYIRRFSLDMLKIDKSFVDGLAHEPDDVAIVEHVIGMARALGMVTVAEGVEQPEQLRQLQRLGCDRAQGYWFSPPVPSELIVPMLTDQTLAQRWSDVRPAAPVTPPHEDDGWGDHSQRRPFAPTPLSILPEPRTRPALEDVALPPPPTTLPPAPMPPMFARPRQEAPPMRTTTPRIMPPMLARPIELRAAPLDAEEDLPQAPSPAPLATPAGREGNLFSAPVCSASDGPGPGPALHQSRPGVRTSGTAPATPPGFAPPRSEPPATVPDRRSAPDVSPEPTETTSASVADAPARPPAAPRPEAGRRRPTSALRPPSGRPAPPVPPPPPAPRDLQPPVRLPTSLPVMREVRPDSEPAGAP